MTTYGEQTESVGRSKAVDGDLFLTSILFASAVGAWSTIFPDHVLISHT